MGEERKMTIREVLEATEKELKGISLPVEMIATAQRIMDCAGSIRACLDAMDRASMEQEEKKDGPEPDHE